MEAAAFGKDGGLGSGFRLSLKQLLRLQVGIGLDDAALDPTGNGVSEGLRQVPEVLCQLCQAAEAETKLEVSDEGDCKIDEYQAIAHQQDDLTGKRGDLVEKEDKQGVNDPDGQKSQHTPKDEQGERDVAFKLETVSSEVPPSAAEDALQEEAGDKGDEGGDHSAAQHEEEGPPAQLREEDGKEDCAETIGGTEGQVEETGVDKGVFTDGRDDDTGTPASEGVEQEKPCQLFDRIIHNETPLDRPVIWAEQIQVIVS